jgi:hypothetical protein
MWTGESRLNDRTLGARTFRCPVATSASAQHGRGLCSSESCDGRAGAGYKLAPVRIFAQEFGDLGHISCD